MNELVKYEFGNYKDKSVIFIKFSYDKIKIEEIKKLKGSKWSNTLKCWYVIDNIYYRQYFGLPQKSIGKTAFSKINIINQKALDKYIQKLTLMGYSKSTLQTYTNEFVQLLYLLGDKCIDELTTNDLERYLLYCIKTLNMSENHVHSRINAIKFYFEKVLMLPKIVLDLPRPRKPLLLPKVLDINDIAKMIRETENIKHKSILMLAYGMGLRVSEIVQLEITDIDSKRMQVHIRGAKGKKDRYTNLPNTILPYLRDYYKTYKPKKFLFEGQYGEKYSIRSAQQVFKQSIERSKINKKASIHCLRHSYATHLLEQGTEISYIQKLLGHNDIKTTLIYAQVGKKEITAIKSPLDKIKL